MRRTKTLSTSGMAQLHSNMEIHVLQSNKGFLVPVDARA
jgi:hypothetical protein